MNLKKAELRFKREWANAAKKLGRELPQVEVVAPAIAADIVVSFTGFPEADALDYTGCKCNSIVHNSAVLIVPPEWVSAPSRRMLVTSAEDRLHNALLDAGVADWIDITSAEDGVNLTVNLLDILTGDQLAKLNAHYDVVLREQFHPAYSFAERTSGTEPQTEAAPLVDPAKVEAKVRQCWAGGHGGKIAAFEAQADPREFIVTTFKSVPLNANLRNHGLALVKQIAPEITHVRVMDELWAKLLGTHKPVSTTVVFTATVSDGDTEPVSVPDEPIQIPDLDDRDVELNALRTQVEELQEIIRAFTPVSNEWQTLRLTIKREGSAITAHPEIAAEEAKGWRVHHVQFAPNGEDRLFVLMERKPQATPAPRYTSAYATAGALSSNGRIEQAIMQGSGRLEQIMIRDMNAEIADSARALRNAFHSLQEIGN